jgi:hypothetical protein
MNENLEYENNEPYTNNPTNQEVGVVRGCIYVCVLEQDMTVQVFVSMRRGDQQQKLHHRQPWSQCGLRVESSHMSR